MTEITSNKLEVAMKAKVPKYYWGNWLIENTIVTLTGAGGVSKTTLAYDLFLSLIGEREYFGVKGIPLKILYFDNESNDALIHARLRLLGKEHVASTPHFEYINDPRVSLKDFEKQRDEWVSEHFKPDVIVLDPVTLLCPGEESDNKFATSKMNHLRELIAKWHCTFFLVFHPAKEAPPGDNVTYIRGAGAWANLADVCMNIYRINEKYGSSLAILEIPKNRWCNDSFRQCLKLEEGEFIPIKFPELYLAEQSKSEIGGLETYTLMSEIKVALENGEPHSRKELWEKMGIGQDKEVMFHRAVTALQQKGEVANLLSIWTPVVFKA